jgi:hypothetical protein
MKRPYTPPPDGVRRDDLIRRLIFRGVNVEGPAIIKLISNEMNVIVQPLTDPVAPEVVRSIARAFLLSLEHLYEDRLEGEP